jgi:hypothetical protein
MPVVISQDDVFTALFLIVGSVLVIRSMPWVLVKNLVAKGWPTHQGTVEFGWVEERRVRHVRYYIARVDYSYSVHGEYYSGCLMRAFFRERSADKFVESLKGQMVFVRSNSLHPERSALLRHDQSGRWPVSRGWPV